MPKEHRPFFGPAAERPGIRRCGSCLLSRPEEDFRRRNRGSNVRMRQCRACHNRAECHRRKAQRRGARGRAVRKGLSRLTAAPHGRLIVTICSDMVRTFGGVDAFCTAWADRLRHDLDGGGYAALRHLEAILRLSQYCAERRHRAVQDMTDAELEEAVAAYVKSPAVSM